MPTLQEWRQALSTPRLVEVESSQALINEVQQKHDTKDAVLALAKKTIPLRKGNLTVVAPFAPTRTMQIVPAALLHRLGVVTTPQIENLADLSSIWAYIRYIWAFDLPDPALPVTPLRLSEAAQRIDFHQKAVLSDQIGIAMAASLLETELNAPLSSDVSVAMNDPAWPIDTLNRSSPDYLFFNMDQTNLYVVECKGTQSSRSAALEQLRRGCEQAASLIFTDGRQPPPGMIVATYLSPTGTKVLILDPPGDEHSTSSDSAKAKREREWKIADNAAFLQTTRRLSEARVLSFAGLDQAAADKLERAGTRAPVFPRSTPRELVDSENEFGRFRGARQRVGLRDRFTLEVYQAVETEVAEAFISEEEGRGEEALRSFQVRASAANDHPGQQPVHTQLDGDVLVVRSAGADGSLLEIRVTPQ
jgi:hypothetical protein